MGIRYVVLDQVCFLTKWSEYPLIQRRTSTLFLAQLSGGSFLAGRELCLLIGRGKKGGRAVLSWRWWKISLVVPVAACFIGLIMDSSGAGILGFAGVMVWALLTMLLDSARAFDCSPLFREDSRRTEKRKILR